MIEWRAMRALVLLPLLLLGVVGAVAVSQDVSGGPRLVVEIQRIASRGQEQPTEVSPQPPAEDAAPAHPIELVANPVVRIAVPSPSPFAASGVLPSRALQQTSSATSGFPGPLRLEYGSLDARI